VKNSKFFHVALRPDSASFPPLTGLRGYTYWTHQPVAETSNWHHATLTRDGSPFEPKIPATERPQTHALNRTTAGIGECSEQEC